MEKIEAVEELRNIQLSILQHIDSFCEENNLRFFLSYGTMLGAVRHQGYIPWDDDIDIMMLRDDYERFINEYIQKDKSKYRLHYYKNDKKCPYPFVKIEDSETILIEYSEETADDLGINIDVFPIDVVPENKSLQKKLFAAKSFYHTLIDLKRVAPAVGRSWYKNTVLVMSQVLLRPIPMSFLMRKIDENAKQYQNQKSVYCAVAVWGYGKREINLRSNWEKPIRVKFEHLLMPIPEGYDNYLSCVYGDYMQLPPEEKRITHHRFEIYRK